MKKIILGLIATIAISNLSFGQATLEHSYSSSGVGYRYKYCMAFSTQSGLNHFTFDVNTKVIKIYNETHLLTHTFTVPLPLNSSISDIINITDNLFNSDSSIEFLIALSINDNGVFSNKMILVNDNGIILQEFNNTGHYAEIYKTSNGIYKLIIKKGNGPDYILDVYSLPGTLSINQQQFLSKKTVGYPNPTENNISITNNLESGKIGILEVFNTSGQKVLEKEVVSENNEINVDVSTLSSGVYIYKLNGETNKFIKN